MSTKSLPHNRFPYQIDDEWQCEYCGWELMKDHECPNKDCKWLHQAQCDECGSYEQAYNCMNISGPFTHIPETTENEALCLCPYCFKQLDYLKELHQGKAFNYLPVRVEVAA